MNPQRYLLASSALAAAVVAALGLWPQGEPGAREIGADHPSNNFSRPAARFIPASESDMAPGATALAPGQPSRRPPAATRPGPPAPERAAGEVRPEFKIAAPPGSPPEAVAAARQVEIAAREKLAGLSERYRLTPSQEAAAFPMVAAATAGYSPAFLVNGASQPTTGLPAGASPAAAPAAAAAAMPAVATAAETAPPPPTFEDQLYAILDPDQGAQLADDVLDEVLWWQDILTQLESDLDATVPATADPASGGSRNPVIPARGGESFDDAPTESLDELFGN
jgi:hypothetical protein